MSSLKRKFIISAIILLFFIILVIAGIIFSNNITKKQVKICFKNNCFFAELAINSYERQRGLMFREYLDSDKGMLFVFDMEEKHSFWMKNTLIPLDIIWLDRDKQVVFISKNTQPCAGAFCPNIQPDKNAKYVLEINAGIADKIGLTVGEKLQF